MLIKEDEKKTHQTRKKKNHSLSHPNATALNILVFSFSQASVLECVHACVSACVRLVVTHVTRLFSVVLLTTFPLYHQYFPLPSTVHS